MILLIAGASHTGKTALAQRLLEKYKYPYLSIDHLKMGLIRSGNTISQKISNQLGYQHISMDSIIAGIESVFPETGIHSDAETDLWENIQYISSKMALFIRAMIDSGEYDECAYGMVIDIFQLLPQHYIQHIDSSVCEIYYFGTAEVTSEERYELLTKYDTPKDYTYYKSDEENKADCASIVTISKRLKEQCRICHLPYYDTSYNREWVFQSILGPLQQEQKMFLNK